MSRRTAEDPDKKHRACLILRKNKKIPSICVSKTKTGIYGNDTVPNLAELLLTLIELNQGIEFIYDSCLGIEVPWVDDPQTWNHRIKWNLDEFRKEWLKDGKPMYPCGITEITKNSLERVVLKAYTIEELNKGLNGDKKLPTDEATQQAWINVFINSRTNPSADIDPELSHLPNIMNTNKELYELFKARLEKHKVVVLEKNPKKVLEFDLMKCILAKFLKKEEIDVPSDRRAYREKLANRTRDESRTRTIEKEKASEEEKEEEALEEENDMNEDELEMYSARVVKSLTDASECRFIPQDARKKLRKIIGIIRDDEQMMKRAIGYYRHESIDMRENDFVDILVMNRYIGTEVLVYHPDDDITATGKVVNFDYEQLVYVIEFLGPECLELVTCLQTKLLTAIEDKLESDRRKKRDSYDDLKEERQRDRAEIRDLRRMNEELKETEARELADLRKSNNQLRAKIETLETKVANQEVEAKTKNAKIDDLETRLRELRSANARRREEAHELFERIRTKDEEIVNLESRLGLKDQEKARALEKLRKKLELESEGIAEDNEKLVWELATKTDEITALRTENRVLEEEVETKNVQIASMTTQISELQTGKEDLEGQLDTKNVEIATMTKQVSELQTEKEDVEGQLDTKTDEIIALQTGKDDLEGQLETKNGEIATITKQVSELQTGKEDLEGQLATKTDEINALRTENEELSGQVETKNREIARLETGLEEVRTRLVARIHEEVDRILAPNDEA